MGLVLFKPQSPSSPMSTWTWVSVAVYPHTHLVIFLIVALRSTIIILAKNGKTKNQGSCSFQEIKEGIFLCRNKGCSQVFNTQSFLRPRQHHSLTRPLGFLLACEYATPGSTVLGNRSLCLALWQWVSACCNPLKYLWQGRWGSFTNLSSSLFSFFPKALLSQKTFKPVPLTPLHTNIIVCSGTFSLSNLPWNWVIAL